MSLRKHFTTKSIIRCLFCGKNSKDDPCLSFFRFPREQERFSLWKANINMEKLESVSSEYCYEKFRLCSEHFEEGMFSSLQKNRLKKDAIPTVFNVTFENIVPVDDDSITEELEQPALLLSQTGILHAPVLDPSTSTEIVNFPGDVQFVAYDEDADESPPSPVIHSPDDEDITKPGCSGISAMTTSFSDSQQPIDVMTQTSRTLTSNTPRKEELRKKIRGLRRKILSPFPALTLSPKKITFDDVSVFLKEHLSEKVINFIKTQIELTNKSPKGSRYSSEYKQFALTIHFLSPKVYKFLSKIFRLPSISTLSRVTHKWDISPGFSDFLFSVLKLKSSLLTEQAKDCILCLDEMSLKTNLFYNLSKDEIVGFHQTATKNSCEPANHALVLMARGIHSNWKMPLAYFFVHSSCNEEDLKDVLFKSISKLKCSGLNVLCVVSDHGGNFHKLTESIGVSPSKPYFLHEDSKIFYMIDVPHLLKSTRNMFFKHSFVIGEHATSKKHLDYFYASDKQQKFRLAPKLTDKHIFPNNFQKMKVKLASQVFSATVAAALNTYISFGQLPSVAITTVEFIEKMDNLFDILNSSKFSGCKDLNRPFMGTNSQKKFLKDMFTFFDKLLVISAKGKKVNVNFIDGWKLSISAFLGLWDVLKAKGVHKIHTRRLNQDCLENFFGKVRQQNGNCRNPTPIMFLRTFKKMFALNHFESSEGTNCVEEFDSILGTITPEFNENSVLLVQPVAFIPLKVYTTDYQQLNITEKNAFTYISGYLMKKCLDKHSCNICKEYARSQIDLTNDGVYAQFRAYQNSNKDTYGNLKMPEFNFVIFLNDLENVFCNIFPLKAMEKCVGNSIRQHFSTISFRKPCEHFPLDYLLSLFIRVRIFYTLKFFNRDLKSTKTMKPCSKLNIVKHL